MKRIVCLGGGPAGLYSAILFKKALPRARVEVIERNRPDDTFGWGVVFSDQTMAGFRAADPESHDAITADFHHWDDIDVHFRGTTGALRRTRLLRHRPQAPARTCCRSAPRALGVQQRFQQRGRHPSSRSPMPTSSIAADGVNSRTRQRHAAVFKPDIDVRKCRFIWLGTTQTVPGIHLCVRADRARLVPDPCLPVQRASSRPSSSKRARRPGGRTASIGCDTEQSVDFCERLFARYLGGHRLHEQRAAPARLGLAQFQPRAVRALAPRQPRADRRCRAHGALRHRLRNQARDGGCRLRWCGMSPRPRTCRRHSWTTRRERLARGAEAAERGAQPHGVVRERRALHAPRALAVRVQPADGQPAHRPRQPALRDPRLRRRGRGGACAARGGVAAPRPPMFLPFTLRGMRW